MSVTIPALIYKRHSLKEESEEILSAGVCAG